jgi:outer membrane protein with beta-barrel domain
MRMFRAGMTFGALAALLLSGVTALQAQERKNWTVTPMAGVLDWDFADQNFAMFAIRADRPMSKLVRFEFESSLTRVDVQTRENGTFDRNAPREGSSLATVSIGFQARHRTRWVEPYGGISFGLFFRRDDDADNVRTSQSTIGFPVGLRIFLTDRIGLRGEIRLRRDQTAFGVSSLVNWEKTLGISWTFGG